MVKSQKLIQLIFPVAEEYILTTASLIFIKFQTHIYYTVEFSSVMLAEGIFGACSLIVSGQRIWSA